MADRSSKKIFPYPGGFIKSETFRYNDKDPDDHIYAIVWGSAIYDPRIYQYKSGMKKTEFAIRYKRSGYIVVTIWGDCPAADEAALVRAKERVLVAGIITKHEKTLNDGSVKETRFFHPQCVIPLDRLLELMMSGVRMQQSPSIKELLDKDAEDIFESEGDFDVVNEDGDDSDGFNNLFV